MNPYAANSEGFNSQYNEYDIIHGDSNIDNWNHEYITGIWIDGSPANTHNTSPSQSPPSTIIFPQLSYEDITDEGNGTIQSSPTITSNIQPYQEDSTLENWTDESITGHWISDNQSFRSLWCIRKNPI